MIGWLQVAMDDSFLMSMMHSPDTLPQKAIVAVEIDKSAIIAEFGDGYTVHQLHHKIRPAALGGTSI